MGEMFATSQSVFHFRIRTSFQVPGFEWVHELLLLCLTSNSAQFCAEIACGKTGLGHNCTDSRFRMKNDFLGRRRGALRRPQVLVKILSENFDDENFSQPEVMIYKRMQRFKFSKLCYGNGKRGYCRFHLVCPGIKFGERNFFWAWYKMKVKQSD